jgi:hypothetical protein
MNQAHDFCHSIRANRNLEEQKNFPSKELTKPGRLPSSYRNDENHSTDKGMVLTTYQRLYGASG